MSVNQKVYAALVAMGTHIATGENAKQTAKKEIGGAYDQGILAASMSADRAEFEETFGTLESNIQYGRDNLHEIFGAQKRTREDKKRGRLYKLPQSISNVKNVVLAAFDREVPFVLPDPKTGKPEVRTFNQVQKEVTAAKEKAEAIEATKLEGRPRLEYDTRALLAKVGEGVSKMALDALQRLHGALTAAVLPTAAPATVTPITTVAATLAQPESEAQVSATVPSKRRGRAAQRKAA